MAKLADEFERALLSLDRLAAGRILSESGCSLTSIQLVEKVMVPVLERIGDGWEKGTIALSQVYMSGRICEELVDDILPPGDPNRKDQPRMAIAVLLDYHQLGKRIVYSTLRASGFDLLDFFRGGSGGERCHCQGRIRRWLYPVGQSWGDSLAGAGPCVAGFIGSGPEMGTLSPQCW